jgi:hypothetical protein
MLDGYPTVPMRRFMIAARVWFSLEEYEFRLEMYDE